MHNLSISLGIKPVKEKLIKMHPHITLLVKSELEKLLKDTFIQAINYVDWISNIVPVSKAKKCIHMFIDFRDLNKAFPKDNFLLPNIDMIVDLTNDFKYIP